MYDENKYNENGMEKDESGNVIIDGTAEVLEERTEEVMEAVAEDAAHVEGACFQAAAVEHAETAEKETSAADMSVQSGQSNVQGHQPSAKTSQQGSQPQNQSRQPYGQYPHSQNGQYNQNGQYSQGRPYGQQNRPYGNYQANPNQGGMNGVNGQNRPGYNPYQYEYYQNPNQNRSYQPNASSGGNAPKKKGRFFKKAVLLTAGALFFGVVSGATMFGVNRAANLLFPMETQTPVQQETQAALDNTQTLPAPQETQAVAATGVVIEDVSPIVEAAMPSVVAINNTTLYQSSTWFGQTQTYEVPSSGSGIIVGQNETELLIVTNHHVIEDSNTLSVTFIDESTVDAAIKGTDSESDLAVIAVPLDKIAADTKAQIKAATIGDSNTLKMGQGVIAIGNALGHGQSVTVGHVSALDREVTVDGVTRTVIQTDAAINPGNSGGALLNAKGELIGINEAKYADETVEGVGYAIPISYAMDIIEDLKLRTTKVEVAESEQGYLGIQVRNVDSVTAEMFGMPEGVYVYKIMEDSAAANSDLRENDIITKFDGETVKNNADLTGLLAYYKAGSTVTITVQSLENGAYVEREVEVVLKNRPDEDEAEETQAQSPGGMRPRG